MSTVIRISAPTNEEYAEGVHVELEDGQVYTIQSVCLTDEQVHEIVKADLAKLIEGFGSSVAERAAGGSTAYYDHDIKKDLHKMRRQLNALKIVGKEWYGIRSK